MDRDWAADGLNNVEHSFGTKFVWGDSNPFMLKALRDQKKVGVCFSYSMLWCRQLLKLGRKPSSKAELVGTLGLMVAAQAMQSWQVRQNKSGAFGSAGMFGEAYYKAMAAAFCMDAQEAGKGNDKHQEWVELVTGQTGAYVIAFTFVGGGAHAVAISSSMYTNENVFFDPLYGQFSEESASPWGQLGFQAAVETGCKKVYTISKWYAVKVTAA